MSASSTLLAQVKKLSNVTLMEYTTMVDIIERDNKCYGAIIRKQDGTLEKVTAAYTVMACGGVGGLYRFSTNFRHLTGDSLAIAKKHGIELKNPDYVQIHPTTFYTKKHEDRSFLISESVRGEGAKLLDKNMNRFVDELLPRDVLTGKIREQMKKDGTDFVWEDLRTIPRDELISHFPNIIEHCKEMGYDVFKEPIPVVPAQHYFMGGVKVNHHSRTSMEYLYAVGETACNGVHGRNRLASNSLLESLVFAKRAAGQMAELGFVNDEIAAQKAADSIDLADYSDEKAVEREYRKLAMEAIEAAAQHDVMGGGTVNHHSRTSMEYLYAVGETACNGVHGRNRLASNSLLESLVFAKRAAGQMAELGFVNDEIAAQKAADSIDLADYSDEKAVEREYRKLAMEAIEGRTGAENMNAESGVTYIQA